MAVSLNRTLYLYVFWMMNVFGIVGTKVFWKLVHYKRDTAHPSPSPVGLESFWAISVHTLNNVFVRLRFEPEFENEKRSNSEWIVLVPKCPTHEVRYPFCDNSPLRPLISMSRVSMCSCKHTPAMEAKKRAYGVKIWLRWGEWSKPLWIVCGNLNLTKTKFHMFSWRLSYELVHGHHPKLFHQQIPLAMCPQ